MFIGVTFDGNFCRVELFSYFLPRFLQRKFVPLLSYTRRKKNYGELFRRPLNVAHTTLPNNNILVPDHPLREERGLADEGLPVPAQDAVQGGARILHRG